MQTAGNSGRLRRSSRAPKKLSAEFSVGDVVEVRRTSVLIHDQHESSLGLFSRYLRQMSLIEQSAVRCAFRFTYSFFVTAISFSLLPNVKIYRFREQAGLYKHN